MEPTDPRALRNPWKLLQAGEGLSLALPDAPGAELVYRAVWAYSAGDVPAATELLDRATATSPESLLVAQLRRSLHAELESTGPASGVYDQAGGFARFIRGGGNVALYTALGAALRGVYDTHRPRRILDVGPGDGRAIVEAATPSPGVVDLVEPAAGLLADAAAALDATGIAHRDHPAGIEDFLTAHDPGNGRWSLVQATFSLQCLDRDERARVLSMLARRCDRLVLAEFDVPARSATFEPAWFLRCVQRMERGLAEYPDDDGDRDLVARGFLLPMMLGLFTATERSNHEQPVCAWAEELRATGFTVDDPPRLLHDYWWAPAYLLEATPSTISRSTHPGGPLMTQPSASAPAGPGGRVVEHYRSLLAANYTWMLGGDIEATARDQRTVLDGLLPSSDGARGVALDLGCGSGAQTLALADLGYDPVLAVDTDATLLAELTTHTADRSAVRTVQADAVAMTAALDAGSVATAVCMGDTLLHLPSTDAVTDMVRGVARALAPGGTLLLTYRSLADELHGTDRFLPVRSDPDRIMLCFLEFTGPDSVEVHDVIHTHTPDRGWTMTTSSYPKLRLTSDWVAEQLAAAGLDIDHHTQGPSGMWLTVGRRP